MYVAVNITVVCCELVFSRSSPYCVYPRIPSLHFSPFSLQERVFARGLCQETHPRNRRWCYATWTLARTQLRRMFPCAASQCGLYTCVSRNCSLPPAYHQTARISCDCVNVQPCFSRVTCYTHTSKCICYYSINSLSAIWHSM